MCLRLRGLLIIFVLVLKIGRCPEDNLMRCTVVCIRFFFFFISARIGSLGKNGKEAAVVEHVEVRKVRFIHTSYGARIKTWQVKYKLRHYVNVRK
jgi:hypothetical protein